MNVNARFLQEARDTELRWGKSLLDGIPDRFFRATTAAMLECQRLHNETNNWDCCDDCREKEKIEKEKTT